VIKAACHIHSDWSYDGKWSLRDLSEEFGRRGYRVLMMTEHDRGFTEARRIEHREACAQASTPEVLVVPGIEYSDASNIVHILVWGPVPFLGEGRPTAELLKQVKAADGIAVLAHPSRKDAWKQFDRSWSAHLLGIEVWNRKTDGWAPSRTATDLMAGTSVLPFVGLDFHDRRQFFPLATALELNSDISNEAVLTVLKAGRCKALAFGAPVERVLSSHPGVELKALEACRRTAAGVYRSIRALRL
jgi:hypothetical protein